MRFPKVTEALLKALREHFKPLPPQVDETYEEMLVRAGEQRVIDFLEVRMKE